MPVIASHGPINNAAGGTVCVHGDKLEYSMFILLFLCLENSLQSTNKFQNDVLQD